VSRPFTLRRAAAAAITALLAVSTTACDGPPEPKPITQQLFVIFDVSGSTGGAVNGYASRAERIIATQPDGSYVTTMVADGASGSSVCIARTTNLQGTGNNTTSINDNLNTLRAAAVKSAQDQVACGKKNNTGGSDLIGSLLAVDARLKPGLDTTKVVLYSDGLQSSADLNLTEKILNDRAALKKTIARLDDDDLIPARMTGADFCITDPGVGNALTAQQAQGVLRFWTAYARKARATFHIC
jgi:hypothetical protein